MLVVNSLEVKSGEMSFVNTETGKKMGAISEVSVIGYDANVGKDCSGKTYINKELTCTTELGLPKKLLYLLLGIEDDKNSHMALYNKRKRIRNKYDKKLRGIK